MFAKYEEPRHVSSSDRRGLMLLVGPNLVFIWVPSHVGLAGNSAADTAAKAAPLMPASRQQLDFTLL